MRKNFLMLLVLGMVAAMPATALAGAEWLGVTSTWDYIAAPGNWTEDPDPATGGVYYKTTGVRVTYADWQENPDPVNWPVIADGNNTVWGWCKLRNSSVTTQTGGYHMWENGSSEVAFSLVNDNWWGDPGSYWPGVDPSVPATLNMTGGTHVVSGRTSVGYDRYDIEGEGLLNIFGDGVFQVVVGNLLVGFPEYPGTHLLIDTDSLIDIRDNGQLRVPLVLKDAVDAYIDTGNFDYVEVTNFGLQEGFTNNLEVTSPLIVNGSGGGLVRTIEGEEGQEEYVVTATAPGLPGDFDSDGDVDGADFLLWQRDTGIGILSVWETNFGAGGAVTVAATAVPEPASALLALLGLGLFAAARRRVRVVFGDR